PSTVITATIQPGTALTTSPFSGTPSTPRPPNALLPSLSPFAAPSSPAPSPLPMSLPSQPPPSSLNNGSCANPLVMDVTLSSEVITDDINNCNLPAIFGAGNWGPSFLFWLEAHDAARAVTVERLAATNGAKFHTLMSVSLSCSPNDVIAEDDGWLMPPKLSFLLDAGQGVFIAVSGYWPECGLFRVKIGTSLLPPPLSPSPSPLPPSPPLPPPLRPGSCAQPLVVDLTAAAGNELVTADLYTCPFSHAFGSSFSSTGPSFVIQLEPHPAARAVMVE
ncbi:hypothetical protein DUNSADRAFT_15834, partial [Dunaliella salina]